MSYFWRLKTKDLYIVAIKLKQAIPELKQYDSTYIESRLRGIELEFYNTEKVKVSVWMRLTLPFAFIVMLLLTISMPFSYIITGYWGYRWVWLSNWLRQLGF